jgi:hypothetical protein
MKVKSFLGKEEIDILARDPSRMSDCEIKDLNEITAKCFGKNVPLQETYEHIAEADFLSLLMVDGKIRGYGLNSGMQLVGCSVNYFGSGFIDPELHDCGLYLPLNEHRIEIFPASALMTRTQNPKVFSGFGRMCLENGFEISPSKDGSIDKKSLEMAREFSPSCTNEQVCIGAYGRELMSDTPAPLDSVANVMGKLNVSRGDGVILIGRKY